MPRANDDVERVLQEYADLLSILLDDAFKPRAYDKAARAVGGYPADISGLDLRALRSIPNIGTSIAAKIEEYLRSGSIAELEKLRAQIPAGVRDMMSIPGLGPKKALALYRELDVASVEQLLDAIEEGTLAGLKGFGAKTAGNIRRGIERMQTAGGRVSLGAAMQVAETAIEALAELRQVRRIAHAGSLRRMTETVGDVDLLVASTDPPAVMDAFVELPGIARVQAKGGTKTTVLTDTGLQVDLRVVDPEVWGAAMVYFTGSKAHNVRIREMAVRAGLKLSEYGLFRAKTGRLIVAETEEAVYEQLGLPWIPPTMREDRGEVEAALEGRLPDVLELRQLRGDLHTHTKLTDGVATLEEMVDAAATHRYAYYAVTDHAENLPMQRMTREKMLEQRGRLRRLQGRASKMQLLHGSELNIDQVGAVDWDEPFLEEFDILVASVHSHFTLSREDMTRRLIRAIEHPLVNVIGHPSARRIGSRPPIEFDEEAVFAAAARAGTALEINSHPDRLDLKDEHVLWARRLGVKFAVDTDAHAVGHMDMMRFGVGTAQRGWLTRDDVINAWPLTKLRRFLRKSRAAGS